MGYYNDIMDHVHNPDLPCTPPYRYPNRPSGLPWEGYYYSAYGIAVKHGYVGTEEEWLASLKGERGFYTELRYNAETNYLQQKHEGDTEWTNLMSLTELQTELEAATIEEVEDARDAAQGYAESAGVYAGSAATSEENAAQSEENASQSAETASQSATTAETAKNTAVEALAAFHAPTASATTLSPGQSATASYDGQDFTFGIPQGVQGDQGYYVNSVYKKSGTGAPGTTDTYGMKINDTAQTEVGTFSVYNGQDGEGSGDMMASIYDPAGGARQVAFQNNLNEVTAKIPAGASSTNKLVSASEMGDAIEAVEAKQLYATASQGSFATKAALTGASTFYNADGTEATPTKNDVAYVLADESHSGKSAKYVIANEPSGTVPPVWGFVITFSDNTFTQAQMDAINSGITAAGVAKIQAPIYLQETEPTGATNGSLWAWSPPPYIVTTVRPSGTEISTGISTLSAAKIKELADAIATEATVDNNVETVYVWVTAENGYYTISIGDQISWTMDGTSYPYRIMGFNHYDKADGSGKAGILFQMVDCFSTKYPMQTDLSHGYGWDDSNVRTILNSTLYGYLPSDVQSAISEVTIKTAEEVSLSTIIETDDKLFLPAEVEVFGSVTYASGGTNEGVWYPWYKANNSDANRVKNFNGSAAYWWERSPGYWRSYSVFCCVYINGHSTDGHAGTSNGVAPCFCF